MNQKEYDSMELEAEDWAMSLWEQFDDEWLGERGNYGDTTRDGRIGGGSERGAGKDITQEEEGAAADLQALIEQVAQTQIPPA